MNQLKVILCIITAKLFLSTDCGQLIKLTFVSTSVQTDVCKIDIEQSVVE